MEDKIQITDEHLQTIREVWRDCKGLSDQDIIDAMLIYEEKFASGPVNLLDRICFPDFNAVLRSVRNQKQKI